MRAFCTISVSPAARAACERGAPQGEGGSFSHKCCAARRHGCLSYADVIGRGERCVSDLLISSWHAMRPAHWGGHRRFCATAVPVRLNVGAAVRAKCFSCVNAYPLRARGVRRKARVIPPRPSVVLHPGAAAGPMRTSLAAACAVFRRSTARLASPRGAIRTVGHVCKHICAANMPVGAPKRCGCHLCAHMFLLRASSGTPTSSR